MDAELLFKSVISATLVIGVLITLRNLYYTCVVSSAGWEALRKLENCGFNPKGIRLPRFIKWLVFWPLLLPAKIHGHDKAQARMCDDSIAVVFPWDICGSGESCAKNAGDGLAEAMTERSENYSFSMSDLRIDEEEDVLICVFIRKKKEQN